MRHRLLDENEKQKESADKRIDTIKSRICHWLHVLRNIIMQAVRRFVVDIFMQFFLDVSTQGYAIHGCLIRISRGPFDYINSRFFGYFPLFLSESELSTWSRTVS
jgi:hypothetical protein